MLNHRKPQLKAIALALVFAASLFSGGCTMKSAMSDEMSMVQRAEAAATRAEDAAMRAEKAAEQAENMAMKSEHIFNKKMKK
jgi:hypothetical protein